MRGTVCFPIKDPFCLAIKHNKRSNAGTSDCSVSAAVNDVRLKRIRLVFTVGKWRTDFAVCLRGWLGVSVLLTTPSRKAARREGRRLPSSGLLRSALPIYSTPRKLFGVNLA
jgi:hypothetical protein